jgi:hypothetical protein
MQFSQYKTAIWAHTLSLYLLRSQYKTAIWAHTVFIPADFKVQDRFLSKHSLYTCNFHSITPLFEHTQSINQLCSQYKNDIWINTVFTPAVFTV